MFTGIVTEMGTVASVRPIDGGVDLEIEAPDTSTRLSIGASVSVNGCCQTVVDLAPATFRVQAVGATLERTTLGRLGAGARVNLETSLRLGDELGGHLVTGHVDGVGHVRGVSRRGDAVYLTVELPAELTRFAAPRGSVAIDGVSLTVAQTEADRIIISLIPHTLERTVAGRYRVGDAVNIEVDLLARYVDRLLAERSAAGRESITLDLLKEKFS